RPPGVHDSTGPRACHDQRSSLRLTAITQSATRTLYFDQVGFLDAWPRDALLGCRPEAFLEGTDGDWTLSSRRVVQGFYNAYVLEPFFTRGLGLGVVQDAVGEIQDLKLVI